MEYGNTLCSEDKSVTKTCENLKDFLPEDSPRNTVTKSEKICKHWMIFCESCAQSVRSNALQEAVGHGHPELQITLPQLKTQL